eukprot:766260-Hanusia_phi.AAC.2
MSVQTFPGLKRQIFLLSHVYILRDGEKGGVVDAIVKESWTNCCQTCKCYARGDESLTGSRIGDAVAAEDTLSAERQIRGEPGCQGVSNQHHAPDRIQSGEVSAALGNALRQRECLPAMKTTKGTDFSSRNDAKRLSDLRFLMRTIENEATALDIYKEGPTIEEARFIYAQCENFLVEQYRQGTEENLEEATSRFSYLAWLL